MKEPSIKKYVVFYSYVGQDKTIRDKSVFSYAEDLEAALYNAKALIYETDAHSENVHSGRYLRVDAIRQA